MKEIFRCADIDGDLFKVTDRGVNRLDVTVSNFRGEEPMTAYLEVQKVQDLYSVLGRWLNENGITQKRTPEPALHIDERVTVDDVRRIAADEVAKAMPTSFEYKVRALALDELSKFVTEADYPAQIKEAVQQQFRNFLTRAVEMGVDQ